MYSNCLKFESPISDAVSRIRFAPRSNNLLISSWDSYLRLYDVDSSALRLEALSESALLGCCFQEDSIAFSAGHDGVIRRYDLHSGTQGTVGNHNDIANCIDYSNQTGDVSLPESATTLCSGSVERLVRVHTTDCASPMQISGLLISAGFDKRIISWDTRIERGISGSKTLNEEVESISLVGYSLMVAVGRSVYEFDLRNLDRAVQSKQAFVNARIRCICSLFCFKGSAVGLVDGRVSVEISSSHVDSKSYTFRCHPKAKNGGNDLVSVNDIISSPLLLGSFVTGDDEGYVSVWDAQKRRRLHELPRLPNAVTSLSYNHEGNLLAIASSYTYQQANELEEPPQIFIHEINEDSPDSSYSASSSKT